MKDLEIQKLVQQDAVVELPTGGTGVKVALQYRGNLGDASRQQRKELLREKFAETKAKLSHDGGTVDMDTISIAGQTVEGLIPTDRFEEIVEEVMRDDFRVDVLTLQQFTR